MGMPSIFEIRRVVEYSAFFVDDAPMDVPATLKRFNRYTLIRMASVLSIHYGNLCFPDNKNTLFSESSKKHMPFLNKLFRDYYKRIGLKPDQKVEILTYRTSLELWRHIFSIHVDEFTNDVERSDAELLLFKIVLTLNEKILSFNLNKEQHNLDELLFLNSFLTNDSNNYDFQAILQPQLFYFYQLVQFIPSSVVLTKAAELLFSNWGIDNWQQYYSSIFVIAKETDTLRKEKGVQVISPDWIERNKSFVSLSFINHLSINEEDYIPFADDVVSQNELNIDYRKFRGKPFVKLKDGSGFVVINNQLLCERLFNSLYFDFKPLINGKVNSCGYFDFNKDFIENNLFRRTIISCLPRNCFLFPHKGVDRQEEPHEPDFYARTKRGELIIVECKAIKMNGECRDDGDYHRLLEELHEKIVRRTHNLDSTRKSLKAESEPIGIGQLIHHIDSIEADSFKWDNGIPDDVIYYPLLVFEDVKLVQKGILSLVNRWFNEDVRNDWKELSLSSIEYRPVMVVSINTLFLLNYFLRKNNLTDVIDSFVKANAVYNPNTGEYVFSNMADFDEYLLSKPYDKRDVMIQWHRRLMSQSK